MNFNVQYPAYEFISIDHISGIVKATNKAFDIYCVYLVGPDANQFGNQNIDIAFKAVTTKEIYEALAAAQKIKELSSGDMIRCALTCSKGQYNLSFIAPYEE